MRTIGDRAILASELVERWRGDDDGRISVRTPRDTPEDEFVNDRQRRGEQCIARARMQFGANFGMHVLVAARQPLDRAPVVDDRWLVGWSFIKVLEIARLVAIIAREPLSGVVELV